MIYFWYFFQALPLLRIIYPVSAEEVRRMMDNLDKDETELTEISGL